MSVQFGKCNFDGQMAERGELDRVRPMLAPYGPDGEGYLCQDNLGIIYRAFHTTRESSKEQQPYTSASGAVITWDGRLDNREELIARLGKHPDDSTDLDIVAAAYERWATDSLARLIGDWALSIWNPRDRSLILAKDFMGTRPLYYAVEKDQVTWCTILDPLVLLAGHSFQVNEEYLAGWLAFFPAPHLTPYLGIHAVPPSSFVHLTKGVQTVSKYWDFDPAKRVRYRTDAEYESHFRTAFAESVRRRCRSHAPVLAELSGGMDSSSIVCMADDLIGQGLAETPRLDTISYYDDSEPNWNERPYFTKVEDRRGRTGCHIDLASQECWDFDCVDNLFMAIPGACRGKSPKATEQFVACVSTHGNRVVLCGTGGDEVTGGVPTPLPDLQDLVARAHIRVLAHRLKLWAVNKRKPWFHLLFEIVRDFFPDAAVGTPQQRQPARWLTRDFARQNQDALRGYHRRLKLLGPLPSFQENLATLDTLRRQVACDPLSCEPVCEKRYPFLDRNFLEFIFSISREQLVRPGQRRSLMRRALAGIVPDEILNRKRKAFVIRHPMATITSQWARLSELSVQMSSASLGIIDADSLHAALARAKQGIEVPTVKLLRTIEVERWLRSWQRRTQSHGAVPGEPRQASISASGAGQR